MPSLLVKDHMQPNAQAVLETASVKEVIEYLLEAGLTGVPVVNASDEVVGFVSEQDCIKEMLNSAFFGADAPAVTQIMHSPVLSVAPNASVLEVAETMLQHKPKNYPVIAEGKLVGLINRRHILRALILNDVRRSPQH